jgi:hypothetical protein
MQPGLRTLQLDAAGLHAEAMCFWSRSLGAAIYEGLASELKDFRFIESGGSGRLCLQSSRTPVHFRK